jgi:hypothetical protein
MARGKFLTAGEKVAIIEGFLAYRSLRDIAGSIGRTPVGVSAYLCRLRDGKESPPILDEDSASRLWVRLGPPRAR